ncbi:MAG: hypothetical protein ABI615_01030 [Chthoniobacterales bacterium]
MNKPFLHFLLLLLAVVVLPAASAEEPAITQVDAIPPRDPAAFSALFAKSPFVMATASEQSPISQRYVITGTVKIGDDARVFLLDKTTQNRLMISKTQADGPVSLISLQSNSDPTQVRATIRAGSETGVVGFAKSQPVVVASKEKEPATAAALAAAIAPPAAANNRAPLKTTPERIVVRKNPIPRSSKAAAQE